MKIKDIYVMNHSHTDIGYTDPPELIMQYQRDYIDQVINIFEEMETNPNYSQKDFRWNCETFGIVEDYINHASKERLEMFIKHIKTGKIAISGSYFNTTDLSDERLYNNMTARIKNFAEKINHPINSAMTADVNGLSWTYAQSLFDNGIHNFFFCIHTHKGMYPLFRNQIPFYWKTAKGDKLLVWNGEHYMFGNELGLVPGATMVYELKGKYTDNDLLAQFSLEEELEFAHYQITNYIKFLETDNYPYDFCPVMASGVRLDNAPPNVHIVDRLNRLNEIFKGSLHFKMVTLPEFFEIARTKIGHTLSEYEGDCPDWWSDGVGSFPDATKLFMAAQRQYEIVSRLNEGKNIIEDKLIHKIENHLTYYAEHTFGSSESIRQPFHNNVLVNYMAKIKHPAIASELSNDAFFEILKSKGFSLFKATHKFQYIVINPFDTDLQIIVHLPLWNWEIHLFSKGFKVYNLNTNEEYEAILLQAEDGYFNEIQLILPMKAKEEIKITIAPHTNTDIPLYSSTHRYRGCDGVVDLKFRDTHDSVIRCSSNTLYTPWGHILFDKQGIYSIVDKTKNIELVDQSHKHKLFSPVYEISYPSSSENYSSVRAHVGRNKKSRNVQRFIGTITDCILIEQNKLFTEIKLKYSVEGMNNYEVILRVYTQLKQIDVKVRFEKSISHAPENVYIALSLCSGDKTREHLYLDKAGGFFEPWIQQLPGSLIDFYCIQNAILFESELNSVLVTSKDTPLVQLGPLDFQDRILMGHPNMDEITQVLYSWPMNSIWESNFSTNLAGFFEFCYTIAWDFDLKSKDKIRELARALNYEYKAYRI